MTELLSNALLLNEEQKDVEYSDELVRDWFDSLIDSYDAVWDIIKDIPNDFGIGKVVDDKYEMELGVCDFISRFDKKIHLYSCIDIVVKALGVDLESEVVTYGDGSTQNKYWFVYRGYKVFQLESE